MVRRAERPRGDQALAREQQARDAPDRGDLDGLVERQGWQDRRQPPGQHRLPGAGRPEHQQVVPAGGGDLERSLGVGVAAHVREVGSIAREGGIDGGRRGRGDLALAVQVLDRVVQAAEGHRVHRVHGGGLGGAGGGHEQGPEPVGPAVECHRQHTSHRAQGAVEGQLAERHRPLEPPGLDDVGSGEDAEGHRQVEGGALLAKVGWREADRDAVDRELEAGVAYRGADPVPALADRGVRQADGGERGQARGHVHLDGHRPGLDPDEARAAHPG